MTAQSVVKQSDLRRMAAIANEKNVCVEIEADGRLIRVSPFAKPVSERIPFAPKGGVKL